MESPTTLIICVLSTSSIISLILRCMKSTSQLTHQFTLQVLRAIQTRWSISPIGWLCRPFSTLRHGSASDPRHETSIHWFRGVFFPSQIKGHFSLYLLARSKDGHVRRPNMGKMHQQFHKYRFGASPCAPAACGAFAEGACRRLTDSADLSKTLRPSVYLNTHS